MNIYLVKDLLRNNRKVIENYFFMTILQVLNSLFYLLIYPFLIRKLGSESYGQYVFSMSIVNYFISLVSFGFDFPAVKEIALHQSDGNVKVHTVSCIFTAKVYLEVFSFFIFFGLLITIPFLRHNFLLYIICFGNTFVNILFPNWYFQGIQKMRLVTYIQLSFRILSLPIIFWAITEAADVWKFALIITASNLGGGIVAAYIIRYHEKIHIKWMPYSVLKVWYRDSLPFFWTSIITTIKQQSISVIIGSFFSMADVAMYDLANKIFSIPNILFGSINGALFPKIAIDSRKEVIKKVFWLETLAGFSVIILVAIFGRWVILFLGGETMLGAYPMAVIMSFGVLTFLLVSGYIYFIFVPQNKYYLVMQNQIVAFFIFFVSVGLGLFIWGNILAIVIAWSFAGIFEILYCNILIKKNKLF